MEDSLAQFSQPILKVLKQYHTTIVIVVVAVLVALSIFRLSQILTLSTEKNVDGYTSVSKADANFDQKTIDRIDNLKTSTDDGSTLIFPARQSPFVE